jgi:hypothetical protein
METKVQVGEVNLKNEKFFLVLKNQAPVVEWQDQGFPHLWHLLSKIPELSDTQYIEQFAQISNFYWKGLHFQCIASINDYQKQYRDQVALEQKHSSDVFPYRLTDYKIFDVSVMHAPKYENGQLIYFVNQVQTGLPYRVVCPFPYPSTSTLVHYQILPILVE